MKPVGHKSLTILVFLGVIILRFVVILNVYENPKWVVVDDSTQYIELAESLLHSGRYFSPEHPELDFFRAPGYPILLAGILAISEKDFLLSIVTFQIFLSIGCAGIVYLLGRSVLSDRVGKMSAFALLLSPNFLFASTMILSELLFSFGVILLLLWMSWTVRGTFPAWATGMLLGVLALIRPIALYLIVIWTIWYFIVLIQRQDWQRALRKVSVLAVGALAVLIPWLIRNWITHSDFALSKVSSTTFKSYHLGMTLADAEGLSWEEAKQSVFNMESTYEAVREIVLSYPGSFVKTQSRGILRTLLGVDIRQWLFLSTNETYQGSGVVNSIVGGNLSSLGKSLVNIFRDQQLSVIGLVSWGIVFTICVVVLGITGFIHAWRGSNRTIRNLLLLGMITVIYLVVVPGAAGEARFRVPVEPILALFVGLNFYRNIPTRSGQISS